jgi:hypothetical protein
VDVFFYEYKREIARARTDVSPKRLKLETKLEMAEFALALAR